MNNSNWRLLNWDNFTIQDLIYRTQGIDYVQGELVFSSNFGLQRTYINYKALKNRKIAIPFDLFIKGYHHIGSIAFYKDFL